MIAELARKSTEMVQPGMVLTRMRLEEISRNLINQDPAMIYAHLRRSITLEQELLQNSLNPNDNIVSEITQMTHQEMEQLVMNVRSAEGFKREWIQKNEAYRLENNEFIQDDRMDDGSVIQQDVNTIVRELNQLLLQEARASCQNLVMMLNSNINLCQSLTCRVVDEYLRNWKWYQKYDGSNVSINGADLDCIQAWCERLAESLWSTREQIRLTRSYQHQFSGNDDDLLAALPQMHDKVTIELQKLINGSFIFEKQPPQVIKTNTKFSTLLRLLVGNVLSIKISNPVVSAEIVSEVQVQRIFQTKTLSGSSCGNILNGRSNLEYSEASRHMTVKFANLKLHTFKRPGKKGADNVTDEKCAIFFKSTFSIGDLNVSLSAVSLPIVEIVHVSQESQAWGTIFWDTSFSDLNRDSFKAPDQVTWRQFSNAINQKFKTFNNRGLTQENLNFLAEKLFKMQFKEGVSDDLIVSWNAFCKENLQDRQFSFWDWFYAASRVTKEHLKGPWIEGSIIGFMSKAKVEEYLKTTVHGTFILRFSDGEMGRLPNIQ